MEYGVYRNQFQPDEEETSSGALSAAMASQPTDDQSLVPNTDANAADIGETSPSPIRTPLLGAPASPSEASETTSAPIPADETSDKDIEAAVGESADNETPHKGWLSKIADTFSTKIINPKEQVPDYEIDPKTGLTAKDAKGNPIPKLDADGNAIMKDSQLSAQAPQYEEGLGHKILRYALPALMGSRMGLGILPGAMIGMAGTAKGNAANMAAQEAFNKEQLESVNKNKQLAYDVMKEDALNKYRQGMLAKPTSGIAQEGNLQDKRKYTSIIAKGKNASIAEKKWASGYEAAGLTKKFDHPDEGDPDLNTLGL